MGGHEMCVSAWLINRNMPFHDYLLRHIFLDDNTMMALYPSKLFLTTSIFLKKHNSVIVFLYQMYFFNPAISQKLKESWTISVLVVIFNLTPKWDGLFLNFQFTNSCFQEPLCFFPFFLNFLALCYITDGLSYPLPLFNIFSVLLCFSLDVFSSPSSLANPRPSFSRL